VGPVDHDHDLDVAVALINTHWVLADPPDQLTDTATFQRILRVAGDDDLAEQLLAADLPALRALRAELAPLFGSPLDQAVERIDQLLQDAPIPVRLASHQGQARWAPGAGQLGIAALRSRLLTAVADHLVKHGTTRLGVCHADPCRCVYVDRSRGRTRRYCCDQCNDRAAAAAYRQRRKTREHDP
jgi:predicted RNA-binding Zn ribbon-like protein